MKKSKPEKTRRGEAAKSPSHKAAAKAAAKKPVKAAAKAPAKKAAPKKAVKAAAKKPVKPVAKKPAKAAAKAPVKKAPAKVAARKPEAPKKEAPKAAKSVVKEVAKAKAAPAPRKEETKAKAAAPAKEAPVPAAKTKGAKAEKVAKVAAPVETFPAADPSLKRPAKPFFLEVKPGVERVIKRGDKSAATQGLDIQARRKGPAAEESAEELAERIERELQSQSFLKRNRMRPQLCTKCGINAVSPRFTIDRELGYCDICAEILRLGETKEARRMEFNLALKKEGDEVAAEEGEEAEGPAPDEVEDVPDVED